MKSKSKFRYEVLLRLRQQREKSASQRLTATLIEARLSQATIRRLSLAINRETASVREALQLSVVATMQNFSAYRQTISELRLATASENSRLTRIHDELVDARVELVEAMKYRKAIQRLKARTGARSNAQQSRLATAQLDDMHAVHSGIQKSVRRETSTTLGYYVRQPSLVEVK